MHLPFMDQSVVLLVIALLLFGKRLPDVGRSIGKGIIEFKKGLAGIEEDINLNTAITAPTTSAKPAQQTQYKFDPQTGQPLQPQMTATPPGAKFDPFTGQPIQAENVTSGSGSQTSSV